MNWRGWAGQIVYFIDLDKEGVRYVVSKQFKILIPKQMLYIAPRACVKIVDTENLISVCDQLIRQMGAKETGSPRNQNATFKVHFGSPICLVWEVLR